jgi:hypothetical protein
MDTSPASLPGSSVIVNLTKAPYCCDPTGREDCSAAICRAIDDAMEHDRMLAHEARAAMAEPDAVALSPECNPGRMTVPPKVGHATILYFPAGTYRVSRTLGYSWSDHLNQPNNDHLARMIHFLGEDRDRSVIRLDDHCPGFGAGEDRPVIEILRGLKSAVAMQNSIEQLTVETGSGNPGAVGIDFYCNNTGVVRDVMIRSGDGAGRAGLAILKWNSSCALFQRVKVMGFEVGVEIRHHRLNTVLSGIEVSGQTRAGVFIENHIVSLEGLRSHNTVPALWITGQPAHVSAVDVQALGGSALHPAVVTGSGVLYLRDLVAEGYGKGIQHQGGFDLDALTVPQWVSHLPNRLFSDSSRGSLRLPIEHAQRPRKGHPDVGSVCLSTFGVKGDGVSDDSDAIQAALESGEPRLHFPRGCFHITRPLRIPASVEHLDFRFADLSAGASLNTMEDAGAFVIDSGETTLLIERIFTQAAFMGVHRLLDHAGVRTLVLRDIQTQDNALYRNTVPGSKVYLENCACRTYPGEKLIGLAFTGQQVWARQLDPVHARTQVLNNGGDLWVLGFLTEDNSICFHTRNGGRTEIIGGTFSSVRQYHPGGHNAPAVINDESSVSVTAATTDWKANLSYPGGVQVMVREIRDGVTRDLVWEVLPAREPHLVFVPLYSGMSAMPHQNNTTTIDCVADDSRFV